MNIRNLVLKAKLKKIQKENQNLVLFHFTANASQWRNLKNFLHHEKRKQSHNSFLDKEQSPLGKILEKKEKIFPGELSNGISTFFSSEISETDGKAKGCFLFFKTSSLNSGKSFHAENTNLKVISKIENFNEKQAPILLFGQTQSTRKNHVDFKLLSNMDIQTTYQELLFSMQWLSFLVSSSFQDNIKQFITLQERRKYT